MMRRLNELGIILSVCDSILHAKSENKMQASICNASSRAPFSHPVLPFLLALTRHSLLCSQAKLVSVR